MGTMTYDDPKPRYLELRSGKESLWVVINNQTKSTDELNRDIASLCSQLKTKGSLTPISLLAAIQSKFPEFEITIAPDYFMSVVEFPQKKVSKPTTAVQPLVENTDKTSYSKRGRPKRTSAPIEVETPSSPVVSSSDRTPQGHPTNKDEILADLTSRFGTRE